MTRQAPAIDKLSALGLDAVCAGLADGRSMTRIAGDAGVSFGTLSAWIEGDTERSARTREARRAAARMWDEKATEAIEAATACPIKLTSSLRPACGVFVPNIIETRLSSETPDGPWFQTIQANTPGTFSLATPAAQVQR